MKKDMEKVYDPKTVEDKLYGQWLDKGYFHAKADSSRQPYTIVMPPPNITGQLHMGHAIDNTLQDILIRWKRMQGYSTLWLPGTDHASIATEAKIVEALEQEGLTKEALGREKYLERAWQWKKEYGGRIVSQLRKMGSSCDWERERFTMDDGLSRAVQEVFLRLYDKGLIYRGERIINWCPNCRTSISDAEVEHEEKNGHFWHIKYPVKDSKNFVIIATTRPETMLGDTAVAVNPLDERYRNIIGKSLILPLMNKEIPVIGDEYVEMDFGTGCVKITPAHDPNDFIVGGRHGLEVICVMNEDATMNELAGKYSGMDRYEARKEILKDLEELGLLVKTEPHKHNVGACYRCNHTVEPMVSKQWFVKMRQLADPAIKAVRSGETKFIPERFSKIYYNWMENIQDWCISRQLWWGHRIPAYYCGHCGEITVSADQPAACSKCGNKDFTQDPDTLDTWFSSALWPFSTLGWPDQTEDLKYFYPTNVLVTGYDIIFFWVARMIFSGIEQMGETPFQYVFIHGLVRDEQGRKMSKSLGNGIDPLEVIDEYGADALRFALSTGNSPGNDLRYLPQKVESARNFTNKIWNASRFVLMNFDESMDFKKVDPGKFTLADKWILSKVNSLSKELTENMEKFELGIALQKIYDFIWDEYCDWYIELVKPRLYDKDSADRLEAQFVLNRVLCQALKMLHPFMPFVTAEVYSHLINDDESIMIAEWPEYDLMYNFLQEEHNMNVIMDAIKAIRNVRAEMNVPPSKKAKIFFVVSGEQEESVIEAGKSYFEKLAYASGTVICRDNSLIPDNVVTLVMSGVNICIPMDELVDMNKEMDRLEKEKKTLEEELRRVNGKLSNENFLKKAPANVIDEEKRKKAKYQEMYDKTVEKIVSFKK